AAASTASFANDSAFPLTSASQSASASSTTRAQVQADLQKAQRMGYNTNFSDSQFLGTQAAVPTTSTVTRAQVQTQVLQAHRFDANDSLYRN
ncbi:MAG: DUF4148 domain-containing protein, partial [Polaromonas sp.]